MGGLFARKKGAQQHVHVNVVAHACAIALSKPSCLPACLKLALPSFGLRRLAIFAAFVAWVVWVGFHSSVGLNGGPRALLFDHQGAKGDPDVAHLAPKFAPRVPHLIVKIVTASSIHVRACQHKYIGSSSI